MDAIERERQDKLRVAIHEAAHAVVAAALGYRCRAYLYNRNHVPDLPEWTTWAGKAEFFRCDFRRVDDPDRGVICAAGLAGECLHEDEGVTGEEICDFIEMEVVIFSSTDADGMGLTVDHDEDCINDRVAMAALFDEAVRLLKSNREVWRSVSEVLLKEHVLTDGMLQEHIDTILPST